MGLSNYPPGADTPDAPWNEPVVPDMGFEITISQALSKTVTVTTDSYIPIVDYETGDLEADTSEVEWNKVYEEQHFKIQDLLSELKQYVLEDIKNTGEKTCKGRRLKRLLAACDGWIEDECEIIPE